MRFLLLPIVLAATFPAFAAGTAPATGPSATATVPAKPPAAAAVQPNKVEQLWFVAKTNDGAIGYNAKSIKTNPELLTVELTSLYFYKAGVKMPSGVVASFILSTDTFDCAGAKFLAGTRIIMDKTGKTLSGDVAKANSPWTPLSPDSPLNSMRDVGCRAATFKGMRSVPDFAAALKTMQEIK